ncbi:MAG TPA: hypothetical protein PK788_04140 [Gemmatimonadaceae bacterium]|nr:hypothetical protein [Gemmatimonadaceae bacterium]HRQ78392.1 hypothetical protein [Gemmatimonadaceae bacterium]
MHPTKLTQRFIHRRRAAAVAGLLALAACGDPEAKRAAEQQAVRQEMAVAETTARQAAALPSDGLWTEAHLMDRLLRAGVAPRANPEPAPEAPWMRGEPHRLLAGGGTLYAWIYADSVQRRIVSDALDAQTAAPPGQVTPFPPPMLMVTNNNIIVVVTGGRLTNHERIALAIEAGLPVHP